MFRSVLIILVLSWLFIAGCEKKQAEKMQEPENKMESVADSTDTTAVGAEAGEPIEE